MKSQINTRKQPLLSRLFKQYSYAEQSIIQEEQYLIETLQQKIKKRKKHRKVVAATPLGIDITEFFPFKKKINSQTSLISQLSGGYSAWLVLGYCMFNNSLVLPWMMSLDSDKFLRQAWRHVFLNMVIMPFVFYEKRTANEQKKELYKFQNIFKKQSLKNAFLVAFSKALWLIVIMSSYQYTTVAHTLILGSLMNFFLSLNRFFSNSYHFLEPGGQIFIMVGIFLIIKDQILMDTSIVDQRYKMISFAKYDWQIRVVVDAIAIFVSFIMAMFSQYTSALNKDYPSYLGLTLVNYLIAIMMFGASFLFHGASLDTDQNFGIFGVFSYQNFSTFFQLSFFIGFGMLWSYTMISNLFAQPLIPSLSALFQPMISLMIMDFVGLQQIPSGYTVMGYIFIIPGTFLILIGQNTYQKLQKEQEKEIEERLKSLFELSRNIKQSHVNQLDSPLLPKNIKFMKSLSKNKQNSDVRSFHQSDNDSMFYSEPKMFSLKHNISQKQDKSMKK